MGKRKPQESDPQLDPKMAPLLQWEEKSYDDIFAFKFNKINITYKQMYLWEKGKRTWETNQRLT